MFAQRLRARDAQLVFSARNLHTWTKYTGIDPESNYARDRRPDRLLDDGAADVFHPARQPPLLNALRGRFQDDETDKSRSRIDGCSRSRRRDPLVERLRSKEGAAGAAAARRHRRVEHDERHRGRRLVHGRAGTVESVDERWWRQHRSHLELGSVVHRRTRSGDTFSQRNDADQRNLQTNDGVLTPIYQAAQQARGRARDAINALEQFDPSATGKTHIGEMYLQMGYIEEELSQAFCNGIPFGETVNGNPAVHQPLTDAQGFALAIARFDTAKTFLTGNRRRDDQRPERCGDRSRSRAGGPRRLCRRSGDGGVRANQLPVQFRLLQHHVRQRMVGDGAERPAVHRRRQHESAGQIFNAIPFAELE